MPRALLIDDERTARNDLRVLLAAHPEIEITGEAATTKAGRALLEQADYELVFLDIQILGRSGFELVPFVHAGARIIFVTAHNDYALRAFEVNALDYLLKPVKPDRLANALLRVRPATDAADAASEPPVHAGLALRPDDIVHLSSGAVARFAPVADLSVIEAEENYSRVRLADGTAILVRRSLKAWEDLLPPTHFLRVHRTTIVNLTRLLGYRRDAAKAITLQVLGLATEVPVGRTYWPDLKTKLPGTAVSSGE